MSNKVKSTCTESAHQSKSTGTMQRGEVQLWAGMPTIAEKWDKTSLSLMEGEFAQGSRTINRAQTRKNLMVPLRLPLRTRAPSLPPSLSLSLSICLFPACTMCARMHVDMKLFSQQVQFKGSTDVPWLKIFGPTGRDLPHSRRGRMIGALLQRVRVSTARSDGQYGEWWRTFRRSYQMDFFISKD